MAEILIGGEHHELLSNWSREYRVEVSEHLSNQLREITEQVPHTHRVLLQNKNPPRIVSLDSPEKPGPLSCFLTIGFRIGFSLIDRARAMLDPMHRREI